MKNDLVKKNTTLNVIRSICSIVFPLITFPYISRTLMASAVGKIYFSNSIVSYFTLIASLGVSTYALKECSRNRDNRDNLSKTTSEIYSINICSMVVSYIALGITLVAFRSLDSYRVLIIVLSSAILFATIGTDWLNYAVEDFRYITLRSVGFQIISIALMFVFIHRPEDYLKYAIITVLASSGSNLLNVFYRKRYCDVRFTFNMNIKKHLPPIMLFFSMIIAQQIYVNSDTTILGLYKGDFEVGLYSTSVKIYSIVNIIIASVSTVVWPQIAEAYKNKQQEKVNELAKYSLGFIITFGLPSIVGINLVAKEIILLMAGSEYIKATLSLQILTIALFFSLLGGWMGSTNFLPNGKEKTCLFASCASALINIILNLLLIPRWGLNAAALTTALSEIAAFLILFVKFDKKLKINRLGEMIWKPLVGCVIITILSITIRLFIANSTMLFIITFISSIIVYFGILIVLKDDFFIGYLEPIRNRIVKKVL